MVTMCGRVVRSWVAFGSVSMTCWLLAGVQPAFASALVDDPETRPRTATRAALFKTGTMPLKIFGIVILDEKPFLVVDIDGPKLFAGYLELKDVR